MNAKEQHGRRDRYDVTGNVEAEYVDADKQVLVNKRGITDLVTLQVAEEAALASAYETMLSEVRADTPITVELIQHAHARIFGSLFEWAGRWRTVWISKEDTTWPPPDFLDSAMTTFERDVLSKYPVTALSGDEDFIQAVAQIQGEFLVIHPFREGNARTIKLVTNLLSVQTGRPFLSYDLSPQGVEQYIGAAKQAFKHRYDLMEEVIRQALATGRR